MCIQWMDDGVKRDLHFDVGSIQLCVCTLCIYVYMYSLGLKL